VGAPLATRTAKKAGTTQASGTGSTKKKRIYEVAREFNLSSVAMVDVIKSLGHEVKNHMAVCTTEMFQQVQRKFEEERDASRQEIKRRETQKKEREEREHEEAKQKEKEAREAKEAKKAKPAKKAKKAKKAESGAAPTAQEPAKDAPPSRPDREVVTIVDDRARTPQKRGRTSKPKEAASTTPAPAQQQDGRKRRGRRRGRPTVDQKEVEESVRRTMAQMGTGVAASRSRRRRRQDDDPVEQEEQETITIKVSEFTTAGELAAMMDVPATEVIKQCLLMGMMVTINQRLDMDTLTLVADEFDVVVVEEEEYGQELLEEEEKEAEADLQPRPPVVTIMGHVDHGKTSLLDYIRSANVVAGEAGGITQHIGAYHVSLDDGRMVTFLDTPGHEAFTAMRARGAQVTDVVVLIVAADDQVMPQTIEAIEHARAAGVPLTIAINKMDVPGADPDRIKRQLAEQNVLVEAYGGAVQSCEISATTGQGVNTLLELLALETDLLELKANPARKARGAIVEARLDRGRGNVATVLVQTGTIRVGDAFVTGVHSGRVRALLDERGNTVEEAGPSVPVQVLGLDGLPQAGDTFHVMETEREAREISGKRQQLKREQEFRGRRVSLVDIHDQIQSGKVQELRLVIKGDVDGSVEALADSLAQISSEEVRLNVIRRGVGGISETDVLLASASEAIIIGFNVRPDARGREVAAEEHVDIRLYRVIYEVVEDVKAALSGLLQPAIDERITGSAQVRETFQVPRIGMVAGCAVVSGTITRNAKVRVLRDNVVIYESSIESLRRFKDDVREVQTGFECGIGVANFNDVKVGDLLEAYELVETARTLE
jgi:translation initiation factor IF-2